MDFTECYTDTVSSVAAAVRTGDRGLVRSLIKSGLSVDSRDNRGWNALHEAAAAGATECVRVLLNAAAGSSRGRRDYVGSVTHEGESALYLAARHGHLAVVKLLLRAGANLNQPTTDLSCPLYAAVDGGHKEVVKLLVRKGAEVNGTHTASSWTCLHQAAYKGYRKIVCILARKCILEVYDDHKITPLFVAAQYGQQECLKVLIDAGANVNAQALDLATPLMLSSQEGHEGCVDVLLAHGADPNLACSHDWPQLPIHAAAQFGHISVLAKLITVTDRACDRGEFSVSPLYMAVENEQSHSVELLLREGFSPDGQNCNSVFGWESPLSYALGRRDNCSSESVRLLLAAGASLNEEVWVYAIRSDKPEQLQLIIQQRSICRPEQLSKSISISRPEQKSSSMFTQKELNQLLYVALNGGSFHTAFYWLPALLQAGLEPSLFLHPIMLRKAEPEVLCYFLEFQNWSTLPRPLLDILDLRRTRNTWTPRSHQVSLPSLSHLCRLQIRMMLGSETLMQTTVVQQLPLPPPLQRYLQFADILPPSQTCLHPHP